MAKLPRIGITVDVGKKDDYVADYAAAIMRAGGVAVYLRPTLDTGAAERAIADLDGLLVPGGPDLDPKLYGQAHHEKTKLLSEERSQFDLALLKLSEARGLPALGVCLGCQMMNVARGGSLHQHLPDSPVKRVMDHSRPKPELDVHMVTVAANTKLAEILATESLMTNSRHHQALDRVGRDLQVTAFAPDGVIEGIEDPRLPFWVGVQWHPENLVRQPHERLFAGLVAAAGAFQRNG